MASVLQRLGSKEYFFKEGCYITEWWNRAEDEAVSLALVRVEKANSTRRHRLNNIAERYLILEGRGLAEIGQGEPLEVRPEDVLLIPAGLSQRITNNGKGDLIFLVVCTPRFTEEAYEELED